MPYHLKRTSRVDSDITVYYCGDGRWSDDYSDRAVYDSDPTPMTVNLNGKNGGWDGSTVVSE